jgi:hypothetical protein
MDSSGNIVVEYYPRLLSRPYQKVDMEPIQLNVNKEYTTPVCSTGMVDLKQTLVCSIWRTPSGRDIYEKINFSQPPFDPPHAFVVVGAEEGPSGHSIDHLINQIVHMATTSGQVQSDKGVILPSHLQSTMMVTPTVPLQDATSYTPQNHVGTPSNQRMKIPTTQQNQNGGHIPTGGNLCIVEKSLPRGNLLSTHQFRLGGNPQFLFKSQFLPNQW